MAGKSEKWEGVLTMKKADIRQAFKAIKNAKEKEDFLKVHNVKFTHDSFQHLIIWCSDGILTLYPTF